MAAKNPPSLLPAARPRAREQLTVKASPPMPLQHRLLRMPKRKPLLMLQQMRRQQRQVEERRRRKAGVRSWGLPCPMKHSLLCWQHMLLQGQRRQAGFRSHS